MGFGRVESALNGSRVSARLESLPLLFFPVLHDHRDGGCATAILWLLYERDIKPNCGWSPGRQQAADSYPENSDAQCAVQHAISVRQR